MAAHLFKNHDKLDKEEQLEVNYRNYLQSPLQPLADNLESATYETFENDSIKYDLYEESMYLAMLDYFRSPRQEEPREVQADLKVPWAIICGDEGLE